MPDKQETANWTCVSSLVWCFLCERMITNESTSKKKFQGQVLKEKIITGRVTVRMSGFPGKEGSGANQFSFLACLHFPKGRLSNVDQFGRCASVWSWHMVFWANHHQIFSLCQNVQVCLNTFRLNFNLENRVAVLKRFLSRLDSDVTFLGTFRVL